MDVEKDYYAVLELPSSATDAEIKRAYYRLARRYHPDSREADTSTTLFHEVQEAYAVLSDPLHRRAYDRRRRDLGLDEKAALSWRILPSRKQLYASYAEQMLYLLVEIEPAVTSQNKRLPLNLCLVIDRSTSMQGGRLEHVKRAARQIVDDLHESDTLALIAFDDRAEVILPGGEEVNRPQAKAKITALRARGGTEILRGIRAGLVEIGKKHSDRVVSHLILLTDGRTYGDDEACIAEAKRAGARGIGITAMGIGEDWNDVLLDEVASKSGGASAYISSPGQVRTLMENKVRGLEAVFARALGLSIRSVDGVEIESVFRTSPYLEPLASANGSIQLGSLGTDAPMHVVLEVIVRQKPAGEHRLLQLQLTGDVPALDRQNEILKHDVRCTFAASEPASNEEVPSALLSALSRITLYRMQEHAWAALEEGNVEQATSQLEMVATRLLDLGKDRLARAAMLEAKRLAEGGVPTARGRKEIRYGTRSLTIGMEKGP